MQKIRIILPFPDPRLMPNRKNGRHWASIHAVKVLARVEGEKRAREALKGLQRHFNNRVPIALTFVAPDNRKRDLDNLLAGSKNYLDGVAAGLGVDDRIFRPITLDSAVDKNKEGFVILEIG